MIENPANIGYTVFLNTKHRQQLQFGALINNSDSD